MRDRAALFRTSRTVVTLYGSARQRSALAADPAVRRFSHWPDGGESDFAASVAAMRTRSIGDRAGWFNLAILGRDGDYVGDHAFAIEERTARLGIALMPALRGRGLAREVIAGSVAWLRGFDVDAFQAEIDPDNVASLATFEGAGFTRKDLRRDEHGPFWLLLRA